MSKLYPHGRHNIPTKHFSGVLMGVERLSGIHTRSLIRGLSIFLLLALVFVGGCVGDAVIPTGAGIFHYHIQEDRQDLEKMIRRLYAKNPKYQPSRVMRYKRIAQIFHGRPLLDKYAHMPSNEVLSAAFAPDTSTSSEPDRIFLLGLGMMKSIREAYGVGHKQIMITALQVPLVRLQRLYRNFNQVNWRLKTYRDKQGRLLFLTNAKGADGYLNMGYEVIMTAILTRIQDDIYLRGGLPGKYIFDMSTMFVSIIL